MSELGDLECPVCLQEYTETGELVPRILPCHDTVCERCIKRLLGDGSTLKCPVDRSKFNAEKGFKTFHENKYIVRQLKKKREEKKSTFQNCKTHGFVVNLYCCGCQKDICSMCLSENHRKHDVVDNKYWKMEKCEEMLKSANKLDETLKQDMDKLLKMKKELATGSEKCIDNINIQRERTMHVFDRMVDDVRKHQNITNSKIDGLISEMIASIKEATDDVDSEKMTPEMVSQKQGKISEIQRNIVKSLLEGKSFTSVEYKLNGQKQTEEVCGKIIKVEKVIQLKAAETENIDLPKTHLTKEQYPAIGYPISRPGTSARLEYISSSYNLYSDYNPLYPRTFIPDAGLLYRGYPRRFKKLPKIKTEEDTSKEKDQSDFDGS